MDIAPYITAKFNLLLVVTHEEDRVVKDLRKGFAGGRDPKKIMSWTLSKGLLDVTDPKNIKGVPGTEGKPDKVLKSIRENSRPAIFVLKDYQPFLKTAPICRAVRDLSKDLEDTHTWVVITTPRREVVEELQDAITVLEYDLPDRAYLSDLVHAAATAWKLEDVETEEIADALSGLTDAQASNALSLSRAMTRTIDLETVLAEKARAISQDGTIETMDTDVTLDDVAGYDELVAWLRKRRKAFSQEAQDFGLPTPKGVLLVGVPGAGKSLTCKAVAREWGLPLLKCDVGSLFGSYVGQSEANVRKLTKTAEAAAPCVLWLDEIDKGFSSSSGQSSGDSGTSSRVLGTFVTWLQEKKAPVFIVATANHPEHLPAEFLRRGRWDEMWALDLPNQEGRRAIFDVHLKRRMEDTSTIDVSALVKASVGFTGSEIESVVEEGLFEAFEDGRRPISTKDILQSCEKTVPLSSAADSEIETMRQWARGRARNASGQAPESPASESSRFDALD